MKNQVVSFALVLFTVFGSLLGGCAMEQDLGSASAALNERRPHFEIWQNQEGRYYFNLSAANYEIILQSQGYSSRSSALNGVLSVLDNGENTARYELREASNGEWYFVLKARNGRVIGTSETYTTEYGAEAGVQAVINNVSTYLTWVANRTGARFDVFQGADSRYYFNLHARNGEIVLTSQGYRNEQSAYNGIFSVSENGLDASNFDIRESNDGGFYFNLKARNGRVIGTSEVYANQSNAARGRDAVVALLLDVELL